MPEGPHNQEGLIRGGDVEVLSVELFSSHHSDSFKLDTIWQNISIFETVKKNFIEGQITLAESQDLLAYIPIMMNEKIIIRFITPSAKEPYEFVGHVHEIPTRHQVSQGQNVYVLGFVSPELVLNQKAQFSKAYNRTLISDMVKDIHSQYIQGVQGKPIVTVPTSVQTSRVVPTMSPFKSINWLSKWAVSSSYRNGSSYVFFENQQGYYFGPIEALVDSSIHKVEAATYTQEIVHAQEGTQHDIVRGFYSISDIEMKTPKFLPSIVAGAYGSKTKSHDIVLRTLTDLTFDYFAEYPNQIHLEASDEDTMLHNDTDLGGYTDSYIQYVANHYQAYSGQDTSRTAMTTLRRRSQKHQFFSKQLNITVPGDSDRTVGEVVRVELPAANPNLEETRRAGDKYMSGRYLITSLRHSIDRSEVSNKAHHTLHMELSSDSYREPLPAQTVRHWA